MRYIALLRGVNVGGNTMIKMEELRAMFEALAFERVSSYINSGNIAFELARESVMRKPARRNGTGLLLASHESRIISKIETAIENRFGKPVTMMVREQAAITAVIAANPFAGQFENYKEMHVLFLKDEMPAEKQRHLLANQTEVERFAVRGREIYCHLKLGVADSLLGKGFIEKKLKIPVTARNWRTVEKLAML